MSRYIDADLIQYKPMCRARGNGMYEDCEIAYRDEIDDIPTADVVEVVRCKDCVMCVEYMGNMFCGYQSFLSNPEGVSANDYCSYGDAGAKKLHSGSEAQKT